MLTDEPPQTQGDLRFTLLGIPVRVHPMFWLVAIVLGLNATEQDPKQVIIWLFAVFVCILVHEMGHALLARWYGWEPRITLHAWGGLASYRAGYHDPKREIVISLAGPLAGFLMAAIMLAAIYASGHLVSYNLRDSILPVALFDSAGVTSLVFYAFYINIFWGLVNLLPVYPLDGGRVARDALAILNPASGVRQSLWLSVAAGAAMAAFGLIAMGSIFVAFWFGYMAYMSYVQLQSYSGGGGWS